MNRRKEFTTLFLFAVLLHLGLGQGVERAVASTVDTAHTPAARYVVPDHANTGGSHTLPADTSHDPAVNPAPVRFLLAIQRQGKTSTNLLRNNPVPLSESESQGSKTPGNLLESSMRRMVASCLASSETLYRSLTVR